MPSIHAPLQAQISFPLPRDKLENPQQYLDKYDLDNLVPAQLETIPIWDLRDEFDAGMGGKNAVEQLDSTGYAYVKHESNYATYEALSDAELSEKYLEECCELYKELLGATKVLAWNSVVRSAVGPKDVTAKQQQKVEKNHAPTADPKATASTAHVDQDVEYARTILKRAAGDDVFEKYSRCQIINLWRPLVPRVTNKPLLVSDFFSMDPEKDCMRMAGGYGTAYSVSYSPAQRWAYLSHQRPTEPLLLKCYDSNMGAHGESLYTAHVAGDILNERPLPAGEEVDEVPRMSVEVRLFVLHE
ncbi:hypothetical protein JCM10207_000081 [Rhodosporidiobolus poonsookiae]